MAKLRWFQTYERHERDSEEVLQYWDEDSGSWEEVPLVRVASRNYNEAMQDPDYS